MFYLYFSIIIHRGNHRNITLPINNLSHLSMKELPDRNGQTSGTDTQVQNINDKYIDRLFIGDPPVNNGKKKDIKRRTH